MRPGSSGGRKNGTANHANQAAREAMERVFAKARPSPGPLSEITPLQAMLICMHAALEEGDRVAVLAAASAAAP
jgi:hypothetical protein